MSPIAKRRHSFRRPLAWVTGVIYLATVGWPSSALASVPAGPPPAAAAAIPTPAASGSRIYFFHPDHLGSTNLALAKHMLIERMGTVLTLWSWG